MAATQLSQRYGWWSRGACQSCGKVNLCKGGVLNHDHTGNSRYQQTAQGSNRRGEVSGVHCIEIANQCGYSETDHEGNQVNPLVLDHDQLIFFEILSVVERRYRFQFEHKPPDVGPKEPFGNIVGVVVRIGVFVVLAVFGTPPQCGIFKSCRSQTTKRTTAPANSP